MPPSRAGSFYALASDVNTVVNTMFRYASNGDAAAFEQWKVERLNELRARIPFINALIEYLDDVDDRKDDEVDALKAQRFAAIKARLIQSGWEEVDCYITHYPLMRDWAKLVYQPKPLTERIWENIQPKLKPILEVNKRERLAREKKQRKTERKARLRKLVADIGNSERRFVELAPEYEQPSGPAMTIVLPFPNPKTVVKLPLVKEILKKDITADAAEELFAAERDRFDANLRIWKHDIEKSLVELVSKEEGGYFSMFWESRHPELYIMPTSTKFTPESEEAVKSTMLQTLLRADSVFKLQGTTGCQFYPNVIDTIQDRLLLPIPRSVWYESEDTENGDYDSRGYRKALNLAGLTRDSKARKAAKAILKSLGRKGAAYLEMKALGERFVCERCWVNKPMGWAELLDHYSESDHIGWSPVIDRFRMNGVAFNALHEVPSEKPKKKKRGTYRAGQSRIEEQSDDSDDFLDPIMTHIPEPQPNPQALKPMVKLLTVEEAEAALSVAEVPPTTGCQFCEAVALAFEPREGVKEPVRPRGSREEMIQHLAETHEIEGERAKTALLAC